jgi:hypothetical protein
MGALSCFAPSRAIRLQLLFSLMMIIAVAYIREKKQNLERSRESNK